MKRIILTLFAVSMLAATAFAATKRESVNLDWRNNYAAVGGGGIADSLDMGAVGTAVAHNDTSTVIDMSRFVMPDKGAGQLPTASDSLAWLRLSVFPVTSTPAVLADSILVTIQVSNDGVLSWITATPTHTFYASAVTPLSNSSAIVLEQGSSNTFAVAIRQRVGAVAYGDLFFPVVSGATAPTWQQLFGYPYMRVIITHSVTNTGRFDAKLTGFVPACD